MTLQPMPPDSHSYEIRPDQDLTILIPARAGSVRVPGKNTRMLGGKPLIQWTIEAALAANVSKIIVSTDDIRIWTATPGGVHLRRRKPEHATAESPDIDWLLDVLPMVKTPHIAICRPTNPFRTASTIRRGYAAFLGSGADSIRAVTKVTHPHPAKMWRLQGRYMMPILMGSHPDGTPYHSSPTQSLPEVYAQNASLEIVHRAIVECTKTISGYRIAPFLTDARESFDINTEADFTEAEAIASSMTRSVTS
jgi:CMP-N,N'-diacetyllegionaminic acid synthase